MNLSGFTSGTTKFGHLGIRLVIRLLNMAGVILAFLILVSSNPDLARLLESSAFLMDFPLLFGTALALAIIVVAFKLIADIIEICIYHLNIKRGKYFYQSAMLVSDCDLLK